MILYKYRNWFDEYHKNVLRKNELYFSSPKDLNDPFDCRITQNLDLLNTSEKEKQYVDYFMKHTKDFLFKNGAKPNEITAIEKGLIDNLKDNQILFDNMYFDEQDIFLGILSLSCSWNITLMWSHYTNNHTGYCIGLNKEKLDEYKLYLHGDVVKYYPDDRFPDIDPLKITDISTAYLQIFHKAYHWEYECEYRLIRAFETLNPEEPESPTNPFLNVERRIYVPDDCIAEVIIGLNTSPEDEKEIICYSKKKNIKVYKAKKVPHYFKLDRVELL